MIQPVQVIPVHTVAGRGSSVAVRRRAALVFMLLCAGSGLNLGPAPALGQCGAAALQPEDVPPGPDGRYLNEFGAAVCLGERHALVGAPMDDGRKLASGAVYVFTQSGGAWRQSAKLQAPDEVEFGGFGASVALSGGWAFAAASTDSDRRFETGVVYVFRRYPGRAAHPNGAARGAGGMAGADSTGGAAAAPEEWRYEQRLAPRELEDFDNFGRSLATDGRRLIIGAPGSDNPASRSGRAYIYRLDGDRWELEQTLQASDLAGGGPAAAPASGRRTKSRGRASGRQAERQEQDGFGWSVGLSNSVTLVAAAPVGAGSAQKAAATAGVYVYERVGDHWRCSRRLQPTGVQASDEFGAALVLSGSQAFVGAPGRSGGNGEVWIFERSPSGDWPVQQTLANPGAARRFGCGLAASGNHLVAGAAHASAGSAPHAVAGGPAAGGSAYLFTRSAGRWQASHSQPIAPWSGVAGSGGLGLNGEQLLVASGAGLPPRSMRLGEAPRILQQPADTVASVGSPATLAIVHDGSAPSVRWYHDGQAVPGASGAQLRIDGVQAADAGAYYAVLSGPCGDTRSSTAHLGVVSPWKQPTGVAAAAASGAESAAGGKAIAAGHPARPTSEGAPRAGEAAPSASIAGGSTAQDLSPAGSAEPGMLGDWTVMLKQLWAVAAAIVLSVGALLASVLKKARV